MTRRELLQLCGSAFPALAIGRARAQQVADDAPAGLAPTAAERAAGVTPTNYAYPPLNVLRYGATGDGVTDDRAAIKSAWLVAREQGAGTIVFPGAATYLVGSLDPASPIALPQQQADGTIRSQRYQTQLYFQNGSNVTFDFQGSTPKTPVTGGGAFIMLDGCSDIRMLGPKITGAQVMSSGVVELGSAAAGSGYADGIYRNVHLTGGSGGGATADVVVAGGAVSSVTMTYVGGSYVLGDTLSARSADLGGRGGGFSVPVASVSGAGPRVAVAAPIAVTCTALSGPSRNVSIINLDVATMYAAVYVVCDPNSANSVSHVQLLGQTRALYVEYGVALHNSGDDSLIENLYTYRVNRPFFFYGVHNVNVTCVADQTNFGFAPVVKAYSRSTRNITIRYSAVNQQGQSGAVAKINFQVQADPAVIDPPPTVDGVTLEYDESNLTSGGNGIEFDYYAGSGGLTQQKASAHLLFNHFVITGSTNNTVLTTVALSSSDAQCQVDLGRLRFARPHAANELDNNGFVTR